MLSTEGALASCSPETRDAFYADLRLSEEARLTSVSAKRARDKDSHWRIWKTYCQGLAGLDLYLRDVKAKLSILQVFALRLRTGQIAPRHKPIKAGTVADYLCTVGEEIAGVGADPDPRYGISGKLHIVLRQQYKGYSNDDPPPERVKPVPLQLLRFVVDSLQSTELCKAVADLLIIGYFFLLRPGEYCFQKDDNNPFRLQDVSFDVASTTLNATTIPLDDLPRTLLVHLRLLLRRTASATRTSPMAPPMTLYCAL